MTNALLEVEEEVKSTRSANRKAKKQAHGCASSSFQAVKERVKKNQSTGAFPCVSKESNHSTNISTDSKSKITEHPVIMSLASYLGAPNTIKEAPAREPRGRDPFRARDACAHANKDFSTASHSPASLERRRETGRVTISDEPPSAPQN